MITQLSIAATQVVRRLSVTLMTDLHTLQNYWKFVLDVGTLFVAVTLCLLAVLPIVGGTCALIVLTRFLGGASIALAFSKKTMFEFSVVIH